jgi:NAD-dependent SIR2 family protein deacetylase
LNRSFEEAYKADLCLAMGSSLTVTPAADIPKEVGKKNKLIIVNLQKTPLDKYAYLRINAMCDDVMKLLA